MRLPLVIANAIALVAIAGCSAAPPRPTAIARGDYASIQAYATQLIRHEMDANSVPGLSLALVDDQRIVWAEGFGYADREQKVAATAETLYRVGSISKLFTATAAMQLAEAGRLDIDRPLPDLLPDFAIQTRQAGPVPITPRLLMTHHAGLPRDRMKGFMHPAPRPFSELVEQLHDDYAAYPPGLVFSYSNVGMSLLGSIIERVVGRPYAEHMREAVLAPLGMTHASFETGLSATPLMAKGHRGLKPAVEPPLRDVPAAGLNASVVDLSRFMAMVFASGMAGDHRILKAETVAEMLRPQNTQVALDFSFRIGLGWMLSTLGPSTIENAGTVAHHGGAIADFRSQMYLLPEHKLGVVVLANSDTAGQAIDRIATEALSLALEAKTGIRQPERRKARPANAPLPVASLADHAGAYTTVAGFAWIYPGRQGLRVEAVGHDFDLVPGSDGMLRLDYALLGLFHVDLGTMGEIGFTRRTVAGRDLLIARSGFQEMLVGQRITPPAILGAWRQRLGDYEIANLEGDQQVAKRIRLTEDHGFLLAELTLTAQPDQTQRMPLMPLSDGEALLLGPLGDGGETVRSVKMDGEEQLSVSGYLLRRVTR